MAAIFDDPAVSAALFIASYLCGSIPFGLIFTKARGFGDIRTIGSGNIGATNVLRTGSKALAALTLVCDAFKAAAPVAVGGMLGGDVLAVLAGFGAFLGHIFPVWLRFRGGKGVAPYLGILVGLGWQLVLAFIGVWLLTAYLLRYSSLAALVAVLPVPFFAWAMGRPTAAVGLGILAAAIYFTHRQNIARLLAGTESKIALRISGGG